MPAGFQAWDASGNTVVDLSTRLGRILGVHTTGSSNGSITNAGLAQGTPFALVSQPNSTVANGGTFYPSPTVSFSGTTMSWTFPGTGAPSTIVYGVY